MNSGTKALIEEWLYRYYEIDDIIYKHIMSRRYGKNKYAFTIYDDLLICNLRSMQQSIEKVLKKLEPKYYIVISYFYFEKQSYKDILRTIGYDKKTCTQICTIVIKYIAKEIGILTI